MRISKLLFVLLLFMCLSRLKAQQPLVQFDGFVKDPSIEWAAYLADTFRFQQPSLNVLLANRLAAGSIKATLPVFNKRQPFEYLDKKSIDMQALYPATISPMYDSLGNAQPVHIEPRKIDTAYFNLTFVERVLYVENGRLKSYVPWATAMMEIRTSTGEFMGNGEYFSSCFNFNREQPSENSQALLLGKYYQAFYPDSIQKENRLKEVYGRNIIETLWPSVVSGKYKMLFIPNKLETKPGPGIDTTEATGQNEGYTFPTCPECFVKVVIEEDWYYEQKSNRLFTKPRSMVLWGRKQIAYEDVGEPIPILKIIFD